MCLPPVLTPYLSQDAYVRQQVEDAFLHSAEAKQTDMESTSLDKTATPVGVR